MREIEASTENRNNNVLPNITTGVVVPVTELFDLSRGNKNGNLVITPISISALGIQPTDNKNIHKKERNENNLITILQDNKKKIPI